MPAWANVLLLGLGMVVVGGIVYLGMRKIMLSSSPGIFSMENEV